MHSQMVGMPGGAFWEHPGFAIQPNGRYIWRCVLRTPRLHYSQTVRAHQEVRFEDTQAVLCSWTVPPLGTAQGAWSTRPDQGMFDHLCNGYAGFSLRALGAKRHKPIER